jgi:hypothetical protein
MEIAEPSESPGPLLRYRQRSVYPEDIQFLRGVIARGWQRRTDLARAVCESWAWKQANGEPSIQGCLDLLRRLEDRGHIELAPAHPRWCSRGASARRRPPLLPSDLIPLAGLDVRGPDADLSRVIVRPISADEREGWRLYMSRYHYLGDCRIVGEHVLYAAFLGDELLALLSWAGAALHAPLREAYVGWDENTKRRRLHLVVNNTRFLILPWVRVPHLASRVLGLSLRRLCADWRVAWKHPVYLAETFVDTARFRGTCYRASNWIYLGETAGRRKQGNQYRRGSTPKALFVYPLLRQARARLKEQRAAA